MAKKILWFFGWLLVAMPQELRAEESRQVKYIFWHLLPAEGATPELTSSLEKQLRVFFEKRQVGQVMDGLAMDSLLLVEGNEKYLRCGIGPECLSGLGRLAKVPWVIAGQVALHQKLLSVEMILVDTEKKQVVAHTTVDALGELGKKTLDELGLAIFEPDKYRGSLELSCAVEGADVFIDRTKVGMTPLVGPLRTIAGTHLLEIKKPGHQIFSREIRIPVGEMKTVVALLPEERLLKDSHTPFHQDWVFWTLASGGIVSTVVATILYIGGNQAQENADQMRTGNRVWQDWQDQADNSYRWSYITFGIGGAALLAATVMAVIDVAGHDSSEKPSGGNSYRLELMPFPSGAGICATMRF